MMKLQTDVVPQSEGLFLSHDNKVLLIGSCFTDSIGERLEYFGFQCLRNPFGILYNPFSIASCLEYCISNKHVSDESLIFYNNLWHSWLHHSKFSNISKQDCLQICNSEIEKASAYLKTVDYIILTWGTALAYELKDNNLVVGNCHKVPSTYFERRLLTIEEIEERYIELKKKLHTINPTAKIILTVSPIRHWKEGFRENLLSKSVLHLAVDSLRKKSDRFYYFPSYEIVMDELRDYRFYERDMLHPNPIAIDIIWDRFLETYSNTNVREVCMLVDKYRKMKQHKPFFPDREEYKQHQSKMEILSKRLEDMLGRVLQ
ncbi:MAG: GSCFA domain-containing protein [Bacteroidales bacterium]|nr:GSCFA domain-containing protein [Bacteroidales bacterium]